MDLSCGPGKRCKKGTTCKKGVCTVKQPRLRSPKPSLQSPKPSLQSPKPSLQQVCGPGVRCKKGTTCKNRFCVAKREQQQQQQLESPDLRSPGLQPPMVCGPGIRCKRGTTCKKGVCTTTRKAKPATPKPATPSPKQASTSLKKAPAKVIANFMNLTKNTRKSVYLHSICSNSGTCIAFGRKNEEIKKFFHGFTSFDFVQDYDQIGELSSNGFVYEVNYEHRGYKASAILKSSAHIKSDNLLYEYQIGLAINTSFYNRFPIFVETYNKYFLYPNEDIWDQLQNNTYTGKLKDALTPYQDIDYIRSCQNSKYLSILVQHLANASSLKRMMTTMNFVRYELVYALYQIYFSLSMMANDFTHYDLHHSNVLVFTPDPKKYIQYHFHTQDGKIISFKSRHMIKIIDYGRSYFRGVSENISQTVCGTTECDPHCGKKFGYRMEETDSSLMTYITPWKKNISHDLRLLSMVVNKLPYPRAPGSIESILFLKLHIVKFIAMYGTPEIMESGIPDDAINNVHDAEKVLRRLILIPESHQINQAHSLGLTKIGDLHVYFDREMKYIPA